MIAASRGRAAAGTIGANYEHYVEWKDTTPRPKAEIAAELGVTELNSRQMLIAGMLHPANLKGKAIAGYLNAIRHGSTDIPPSLVHLVFPPLSIDLPANFPDVQTPRYLYGDKLRWISEGDKTDWGIAIGRFYSFAPHHCCWTWCYLIWLDKLSPLKG